MSSRIVDLDPRMQLAAEKLVRQCSAEGVSIIVTETRRDLSVQIAYYLRGRAPIQVVKDVFYRCGLWALTDIEAVTQNTKTLYSKHIDGLAMDVAPDRDGAAWWSAPLEVWQHVWRIAEDECGLDACAGGQWQAWGWDNGHIEWRDA
jgi:hypothetical protein